MALMKGHYQNAYVTNDVGWAMDEMTARYGLEDWKTFEVEFPVETPAGAFPQRTKVACSWEGGLQFELIEPISGYIDPFVPYLPTDRSDRSLRFHHISLRRESLEEIDAEAAQRGLARVCRGGIPDLIYSYYDTRDVLGHYTEMVWASDAGWQMVGWPDGLLPSN